jgi:hypothetical protein
MAFHRRTGRRIPVTDQARPKPPNPDDARATSTRESLDLGVPVSPTPAPKPPRESPHDFVRRRMRDLRSADTKKNN